MAVAGRGGNNLLRRFHVVDIRVAKNDARNQVLCK